MRLYVYNYTYVQCVSVFMDHMDCIVRPWVLTMGFFSSCNWGGASPQVSPSLKKPDVKKTAQLRAFLFSSVKRVEPEPCNSPVRGECDFRKLSWNVIVGNCSPRVSSLVQAEVHRISRAGLFRIAVRTYQQRSSNQKCDSACSKTNEAVPTSPKKAPFNCKNMIAVELKYNYSKQQKMARSPNVTFWANLCACEVSKRGKRY